MRGDGWSASFPEGWELGRQPRTLTASRPDHPEQVSVATFRLRRVYRPDLWDEAIGELELVARDLARKLSPDARLAEGRTAVLAGRRARLYDVRYRRGGIGLVERIAFVLKGRREYQLTCRIVADEPAPGEEACAELYRSFRV